MVEGSEASRGLAQEINQEENTPKEYPPYAKGSPSNGGFFLILGDRPDSN
jgi:hypothetical protein